MINSYWRTLKFSKEDLEVLMLYQKFCQLRNHHLPHLSHIRILAKKSDPRKSKNWKYFQNLRKIKLEFPDISIDQFILAQIMYCKVKNLEYCPPSLLSSKYAFDRFAWYLENRDLSETLKPEQVKNMQADSFMMSSKFILKMMKKYNKTIYDLFCMKLSSDVFPESYLWISTGRISKSFLAVSKSYVKFYETVDKYIQSEFPSPSELAPIRQKMMLNSKLRELCLRILGKNESLI